MATAREEGGYGAGGKFKKRSFRRQTTPYDRPSTTLRNPPNVNINNNNNGWLSKLVDPAQRLIVSSAHRLVDSFLRKRLPPPPPPQPEPEANNEDKDMDQEQVSADRPDVQGAISGHDDLNVNSDKGGLTELEQILKQKTFSRSEIDWLTALLHSRTADIPVGDEQKSPEVIPSKPVVLHSRKEVSLDAPVKENGIRHQLISTPVESSTVLDEDIASPAELAKAYMGSRLSKVSPPSMLGVCGQAFGEESSMLSNQSFSAASAAISLVPRSSGYVGVSENGFVTPRTRGRSAIYSMARTPYFRVHSTSTFKSAGLATDSVTGPSSSQSMWEKNRLAGSKPLSLKRRNSVLDYDIGSVGPIRRIRQKPNLLTSKNLSLRASGSPLSVQQSGASDAIQYPSSSQQMPLVSGQPNHSFAKMLIENGDNSVVPSTSSTPVPSKSSEMASKILQQLDKLVPSREKSPTKLSPSMLHGPALKSLENVDSSVFLDNVQDYNKVNGSCDTSLPDVRGTTSEKRDKIDENGPTKFVSASDKLIPATNGIDATGIIKDNAPDTKNRDTALTNSIAYPHPQKKQAFLMSAHEDYLDLDDDDYSNGPASLPLADGRDKSNSSSDNKTTAAVDITVAKFPAHSDVQLPSPVLNKISDKENNDGALVIGKGPVFAFSTVPSLSMTAQPAEVAILSTSTKAANESSAAPIYSSGEKVAAHKESNAVSPIFSTSTVNVDKVPQFTSASSSTEVSESSSFIFSAPFSTKPESSASFAPVAVDASDSVKKVPESDKADNKVFFRTPESSLPSAASTSSSTASMFSFGAPANSSTLNNGSVASCPSSISSPSQSPFSSTGFTQNLFSSSTTPFATSDSGATSITTTSASMPSTGASIFKFGSSAVPSASNSPISTTFGLESTEAKENDTAFGNSTSIIFGGSSTFTGADSSTSNATSLSNVGTGSNIFGGPSPSLIAGSSVFGGTSSRITSTSSSSIGGTSTVANPSSSNFGFTAGISTSATATSQAQASNPFSVSSAQAFVNATGVATTTQSIPTQFGSSISSTSFGLGGNPTISSSSSPFGFSPSAVKPFGSTPFGVNSSTSSSEANLISSSSGTMTSVLGASWQAPKTPSLFGSTFNSTSPSTVFSFETSASSAASSSTPVFGSSTNGSSSSIFPFSSAPATSSQPAFGNANSVFTFGSAPSNNNDQMSIEDSMAEDTVPSSTPAIPAFGQQPVSPSSSFVFSSALSSVANPFQFGSQPNMTTPHNPSPFQASGSLDFHARGSFSLGTGGGDKSQRKIVKLSRKPRKK